jgi:hypothetical protein
MHSNQKVIKGYLFWLKFLTLLWLSNHFYNKEIVIQTLKSYTDIKINVQATVRQFNKVVYLVLSTVLSPCLSLNQRSKTIEKWILVANECLKIKNYSSLRAVISGLQDLTNIRPSTFFQKWQFWFQRQPYYWPRFNWLIKLVL